MSNATARHGTLPSAANHSRRPGPVASGSGVSPLSGLCAVATALSRVGGRLMSHAWVGPPTTSRSTSASSSGVARLTGTTATLSKERSPVPIDSAIVRVFPNIDS